MTLKQLDEYLDGDLRPFEDRVSGVYFLANDQDEIIYVGQSRDLAARIRQHRRGKQFASVHYLDVDRSNLARLEAWLIRVCSPVLNRCIPYFTTGATCRDSRSSWTMDVPNLEEFV